MTESPARQPNTIDLTGIMDILPHRYPILLVDRILDFERGQWVRGLKNISISDHVFQGHFPQLPVFPGVLIVEAMAQTGGCLLMQELPKDARTVIYFMSMDNVKFRKPVVPGDQMVMEVRTLSHKGRICKMHGEAFVDGQKVAEADFMCMMQAASGKEA